MNRYPMHLRPLNHQMHQYNHIAASMIVDLRFDQIPLEHLVHTAEGLKVGTESTRFNVAAMHATLGCHYLASGYVL
jgi:hypothetical protein